MSRFQTIIEGAIASVPSGKALLWIGASIVVSWFGGVGWTLGTSEIKENLAKIPGIDSLTNQNRERLVDVETDVAQILCYVTLIVNDEDPGTELNPRCP